MAKIKDNKSDSIQRFVKLDPSPETLFRSLILFGSNVQSYKFALGKTILSLAKEGKDIISLDDLSVPYAQNICEHLKNCDVQGSSRTSKFLEACRSFNIEGISADELHKTTRIKGFQNVLEAFHYLDGAESPIKFFDISGVNASKTNGEIKLSNELLSMFDDSYSSNFSDEVEARWRLVEEAWRLKIPSKMLQIVHDPATGSLFLPYDKVKRRIGITSCRDALNGYQRGKCFYCFTDISVQKGHANLGQVDHLIAHVLIDRAPELYSRVNIDGIWNLVLACKNCNRTGQKGAQHVTEKLLLRLSTRNDFLISSYHPLSETIKNQSGLTIESRRHFLQMVYDYSVEKLGGAWEPTLQGVATF